MTCPSTHSSPRPYDVWLAASEVRSRPDFSSDVSDCAHEYGVAGSWVVPTTTIAGARGRVLVSSSGNPTVVTVHPSAILRVRDSTDRQAMMRQFVADLRQAARLAGKTVRPV